MGIVTLKSVKEIEVSSSNEGKESCFHRTRKCCSVAWKVILKLHKNALLPLWDSSEMLTKVMHVWEVLPQYDRVELLVSLDLVFCYCARFAVASSITDF